MVLFAPEYGNIKFIVFKRKLVSLVFVIIISHLTKPPFKSKFLKVDGRQVAGRSRFDRNGVPNLLRSEVTVVIIELDHIYSRERQ